MEDLPTITRSVVEAGMESKPACLSASSRLPACWAPREKSRSVPSGYTVWWGGSWDGRGTPLEPGPGVCSEGGVWVRGIQTFALVNEGES